MTTPVFVDVVQSKQLDYRDDFAPFRPIAIGGVRLLVLRHILEIDFVLAVWPKRHLLEHKVTQAWPCPQPRYKRVISDALPNDFVLVLRGIGPVLPLHTFPKGVVGKSVKARYQQGVEEYANDENCRASVKIAFHVEAISEIISLAARPARENLVEERAVLSHH